MQKKGAADMNMGERFKAARLEAGLSQSQLCRDVISRNMLSLIESGSAKPSLSTLETLAERLHKPVGWFFGEDTDDFTGRTQAEAAWTAYREGRPGDAARILNSRTDLGRFQDVALLRALVLLDLSEQAMKEKRYPYARELLSWAEQDGGAFPDIRRRILLLKGRLDMGKSEALCRELPSLDEELLLRAAAALEQKKPERAAQLLEAAEDHSTAQWAIARGRAYLLQGHLRSAVRCFHQAERTLPKESYPYLEQCYRELEDYKQAYFYACIQKNKRD